jgi:hypothetical protein
VSVSGAVTIGVGWVGVDGGAEDPPHPASSGTDRATTRRNGGGKEIGNLKLEMPIGTYGGGYSRRRSSGFRTSNYAVKFPEF